MPNKKPITVVLRPFFTAYIYMEFKKNQQEAQPSQRDRAMLRVTDYFAKSLKVIQNDTQGCI